MGLAIKDYFYREGKNRKEAEKSLDRIYQQLRDIDEKLKERTDMEIWNSFQQEQQEINKLEKNINQLLYNK